MVNYLGDIKGDTFSIFRTETYPRNRSISGYGSKIPTEHMVKLGKRTYRVYAICYSNVASFYVVIGGQRYFIRDYHMDY